MVVRRLDNVQQAMIRPLIERFIAPGTRGLSGKEAAFLPLPPLRTVLESFPSYGSSLI
ncbi:hypothetical protein BN874_1950004 [Candidatus Contendobacter odensis Run_B_J11]|uniref:Uncharacterized protein n=1 Tax=Candidatus Contendobacter odensis Run_B_J11 TaxID=1400861 RepID=A0A7U7J446_9GAMM|nr:hypothetical protein BN874_1950004 [Candidatus Contendobacter odensis Run_B_J11]